MKIFTKRRFPIIISAVSLFITMLFFAMRTAWSGVGNMVNLNWLPYALFIFMVLITIACITLTMINKPYKIIMWILFGIQALFFCVEIVITTMSKDMIPSNILEMGYLTLFVLGIAAIIFLIVYYPRLSISKNKWVNLALVVVLLVGTFLSIVPLGYRFEKGAVVYAVEDEYQIVFTTSSNGTAWVEVGDNKYYDAYAGSARSQTTIHKVSVPMQELDNAKSYTIHSKKMIMREAYDMWQGKEISKEYSFRGINMTDGFQYYVVSDTHGYSDAAVKAVKAAWGDKLDLLILNGDISSSLRREVDILHILDIGYGATKGQVPVIYARGNHENKGVLANNLHKYVGANEQSFYYTFKLGEIGGVVLDMGEDHADDWWEFAGTADFDSYREKQSQFLDQVILNQDKLFDGVTYRMAICHVPLNLLSKDNYVIEYKKAWMEKLNKLDIDVMYNGHRHQLMPVLNNIGMPQYDFNLENANTNVASNDVNRLRLIKEYTGSKQDYNGADAYYIKSDFNSFVTSRRSNSQNISIKENVFGKIIIGVKGLYNAGKTTLVFTDSIGTVVPVVIPWTDADNQTTFNDRKLKESFVF